jgi:hypothetical protein
MSSAPDPQPPPANEAGDTHTAGAPPAGEEWGWVDEAQAPLHAFVEALAVAAEPIVDAQSGAGMFVESLQISMPFELDVHVDDEGHVSLAGSPPTQYTETTILPVFHQLKLRVVAEISHG